MPGCHRRLQGFQDIPKQYDRHQTWGKQYTSSLKRISLTRSLRMNRYSMSRKQVLALYTRAVPNSVGLEPHRQVHADLLERIEIGLRNCGVDEAPDDSSEVRKNCRHTD